MRLVKTQDIPLLEHATPSQETRQDQVYRSLRQAITAGHLRRGDQVASTRELATRWALSRGTVEQAYERLSIEGYLERRQGSGTFVAAALPEHFLPTDTPCCHVPRVPGAIPATPQAPPRAPSFCSRLPAGLPFASRVADPGLLDMKKWRRHLTTAARGMDQQEMHLSQIGGIWALRQALAGYIKAVRGIECHADDIVITTGIRQSLSILAGILNPADQQVGIEDPGYLQARQLFEARGLQVRSVPVDAEGLRVESLGVSSAVYITPAHQSPLGVTMSASRRAALLDWAKKSGGLIIEDDYDSEYNYLKSPPPALKASDQDDQVVFCSSFNKVLYSSLRIGFMIVPRAWHDEIMRHLRISGAQPGLIEQHALATMIVSGDIYSHIRQSRRTYEKRRNIVLQGLARWLNKPKLSGEHCGFHFVLWLPPQLDDLLVARELEAQGLAVQPISNFVSDYPQPPGLLIAFASVRDALLYEASDHLGRALAQLYQSEQLNEPWCGVIQAEDPVITAAPRA